VKEREISNDMRIHLIDGTYELYRAHYGAQRAASPRAAPLPGAPPQPPREGPPLGTIPTFLRSLLALLREDGVSHVALAFDHVIESFRNDLLDGYKTSEGVPPELFALFPVAERAAEAMGIVLWSMIEFEADDAMATATARWADADGVEQVVICSPDKDLAQCVRGSRVVCFDRMRRRVLDELGVIEKFGVVPASIPDYLALIGDDADGIPGLPRWGSRSAAAILSRYGHIEAVPGNAREWDVTVRGAEALASSLREHRSEAMLYRLLATLRTDVPLREELDDLRWRGARRRELVALCSEVGDAAFIERIQLWRAD
jgi:5'-3' exonuclease